jgi:hypothetical protein
VISNQNNFPVIIDKHPAYMFSDLGSCPFVGFVEINSDEDNPIANTCHQSRVRIFLSEYGKFVRTELHTHSSAIPSQDGMVVLLEW